MVRALLRRACSERETQPTSHPEGHDEAPPRHPPGHTHARGDVGPSAAFAASHIKAGLVATGKDPDARGRANLLVRGSKGKLALTAHRLNAGATFEVIVDGVRIGTLSTGRSGKGKARFSTRPHAADQLLGVDPRGKLLQVRDEDGDDVLETEMPDDAEPGAIRCCVADDDESECEAESPEECAAEGGVDMGEGSCMPNPCSTTSPGDPVRCCIPDGLECEERTAEECSAHHGINIGAGECDDDPCGPIPPGEEEIRCCIAEHEAETGRHRDHDDGDHDDDDGDDDAPECEHLTETACVALGGTSLGAGSCEPNPCSASPSGAFLEALALP
jgi:hypothetical protein